ncbi:MAG TPA: aminotransferase class I/II-fold pyridoxal phosphate-dependent enzyme, partial [Anaerolineae bacterium]
MNQHRTSERVRGIPPSGIRKFFDIAATMQDVISLSIGEPDFATPAQISRAGVRAIERGDTHYTSNSGLIELRTALAKKLNSLYGVTYNPENELLITVGVSEALQCAMLAVVDPGDEVIVVEPCFVAYKPSVLFAGGTPVVVETRVENDFQVDANDIRAAITPRTKMIFIGYPNNPTGAVMSRQRLLEIAAVAQEHDLLVLSDELYDRLVYGVEHVCFATLPGMKERTILLGGWSKNYAMTGWRVGFAAGPEDILTEIRKAHQYIIMSAPTMAQWAALEALEHGDESVEAMVSEYDQRRHLIVSGLNHVGLPTFEPKGAFYAFP